MAASCPLADGVRREGMVRVTTTVELDPAGDSPC
jgi:hypothetical protein